MQTVSKACQGPRPECASHYPLTPHPTSQQTRSRPPLPCPRLDPGTNSSFFDFIASFLCDQRWRPPSIRAACFLVLIPMVSPELPFSAGGPISTELIFLASQGLRRCTPTTRLPQQGPHVTDRHGEASCTRQTLFLRSTCGAHCGLLAPLQSLLC